MYFIRAQQFWQNLRSTDILAPGNAKTEARKQHNHSVPFLYPSSLLLTTPLPLSFLPLKSACQSKIDEVVRVVNSVVNIIYS